MSTTVDTRFARIKDIVCEHLEVAPGTMTDTSLFIEDHDADSLGLIDVVAAIEKEFDILIDQSDLARMVNLTTVYQVVSESDGW
ncbi:acyl carrier protein [Nonomuraea sp. B12E4]|uniref:acyl carrier protein n=1 Tax=Nonomuraea sp. B12E4 TaxID=3153564 RepID=UPI00325F4742